MSGTRVFTLLLIILKCVCVKPRDFLTFCITAPCLVFFLFCFPACLFWCSVLKSLPSSAHKTLRVFHYFVRFFFNTLRPRPPPILPVPHTPNPVFAASCGGFHQPLRHSFFVFSTASRPPPPPFLLLGLASVGNDSVKDASRYVC